jgi:hypothetical protein
MIPVVSGTPPPACGERGQPCCSGACNTTGSGPVCGRNRCSAYSTTASGRTGPISGGGGDGGAPFGPEWCEVGSVAVGLAGRSDRFVNGVQLLCARLAPNGALTGTTSASFFGGTGGTRSYRSAASVRSWLD